MRNELLLCPTPNASQTALAGSRHGGPSDEGLPGLA